MVIRMKEIIKKNVILRFFDFKSIDVKGIIRIISSSRMINSKLNIKKLWERIFFRDEMLLKPHSNGDLMDFWVFDSFEAVLFRITRISKIEIRIGIIKFFISLFSY